MSKRITYLLGIALTIIVGTFLYIKFCCNCYSTNAVISSKPIKNIPLQPIPENNFAINGNNFNYTCNDNFNFIKNDFKYLAPLNDSINTGIDSLKMFFDKNPNQQLLIIGYALSSEKNTSLFPNLGVARAIDIKNYFISRGFLPTQFDCKGKIVQHLKVISDTILGPAKFSVQLVDNTKEQKDWMSERNKLNANPLILYFNTNQSDINLTADERQKVADLLEYLDNVPNSKLIITGHSDNVGARPANIKLGYNRAVFTKQYLVRNDIPKDRIETFSQGPDQPITDNITPEGKAKNRRSVITIK